MASPAAAAAAASGADARRVRELKKEANALKGELRTFEAEFTQREGRAPVTADKMVMKAKYMRCVWHAAGCCEHGLTDSLRRLKELKKELEGL
jgi:hypothetical protein